jgi:hypothetical protein
MLLRVPDGDGLDLGIGKALGDAVHNGRRALACPEACICATISAAVFPASGGTGD